MFKQSPSRNQKSKGFRAKGALKIVFLLAILIWLLYQVKHSHDKKKAFDESNAKLSEKMESNNAILIFGRKGLHPRVEETVSKVEEHNEDEDIEEEEEENKKGEEIKHEEEEGEGEESKPEENDDEGRGGGDDETDEHDREGDGEFAVREEELDEEQIEDQDHDKNMQEAREENYKGDDASSAVVRDTQVLNTETENGVLDALHEEEIVRKLEGGELAQENKTRSSEDVTSDQNDSNPKTGDGEMVEGNLTVNATSNEEKGLEITVSGSENGLLPNSSTKVEPIDRSEVNDNSTLQNAGIPISSIQNGTDIINNQTVVMIPSNVGDSNLQTVSPEQIENSNRTTTTVESNSNSLVSATAENADASNGQSAEEQAVKSKTAAVAEDASVSLFTNENSNEDQKDESEITVGAEEAENNSSSSTSNENTDTVEIKSVDSNDSLISEVREARTDLGTLPEIVTEGTNSEDAVEK